MYCFRIIIFSLSILASFPSIISAATAQPHALFRQQEVHFSLKEGTLSFCDPFYPKQPITLLLGRSPLAEEASQKKWYDFFKEETHFVVVQNAEQRNIIARTDSNGLTKTINPSLFPTLGYYTFKPSKEDATPTKLIKRIYQQEDQYHASMQQQMMFSQHQFSPVHPYQYPTAYNVVEQIAALHHEVAALKQCLAYATPFFQPYPSLPNAYPSAHPHTQSKPCNPLAAPFQPTCSASTETPLEEHKETATPAANAKNLEEQTLPVNAPAAIAPQVAETIAPQVAHFMAQSQAASVKAHAVIAPVEQAVDALSEQTPHAQSLEAPAIPVNAPAEQVVNTSSEQIPHAQSLEAPAIPVKSPAAIVKTQKIPTTHATNKKQAAWFRSSQKTLPQAQQAAIAVTPTAVAKPASAKPVPIAAAQPAVKVISATPAKITQLAAAKDLSLVAPAKTAPITTAQQPIAKAIQSAPVISAQPLAKAISAPAAPAKSALQKAPFYDIFPTAPAVSSQTIIAQQEARRRADEQEEQIKNEQKAARREKLEAKKAAVLIEKEALKKEAAKAKDERLIKDNANVLAAAQHFNNSSDSSIVVQHLRSIESPDIRSNYEFNVMMAGISLKEDCISPLEKNAAKKYLKKIIESPEDTQALKEKHDDSLSIVYDFLAQNEQVPELKKQYLRCALDEGNLLCGVKFFLQHIIEEAPCSAHKNPTQGCCYHRQIENFLNTVLDLTEESNIIHTYDFYHLGALFYGRFVNCPNSTLDHVDRLERIHELQLRSKTHLSEKDFTRFETLITPLIAIKNDILEGLAGARKKAQLKHAESLVKTLVEADKKAMADTILFDAAAPKNLRLISDQTELAQELQRLVQAKSVALHEDKKPSLSKMPMPTQLESQLLKIEQLHQRVMLFISIASKNEKLEKADLIELTKVSRELFKVLEESSNTKVFPHEIMSIREKAFPLIIALFNAPHVNPIDVAKILSRAQIGLFDISFIYRTAALLQDRIESPIIKAHYLNCIHVLAIATLERTESSAKKIIGELLMCENGQTILKFVTEQRNTLAEQFSQFMSPIVSTMGIIITIDQLEPFFKMLSIPLSMETKAAYSEHVKKYVERMATQ